MRYLVDQRDGETEMLQALYRTALTWAAPRSDRFVMNLQSGIYDNPAEAAQLCELGKATVIDPVSSQGLLDRIVSRLFPDSEEIVRVEGVPDKTFVRKLTEKAAPRKAVSGDLCPVEDLNIFSGERVIFASYDYGRDMMLDMSDDELESFSETLREAGLDPARLAPPPPSMGRT